MLIADSPQLLFIHIQRTGGTSLDAILREQIPSCRRFLGTHDFARRAKVELGLSYTGYFKFAFVRNPWDRLVSWYEMIKQRSAEQGAPPLAFWKYLNDNAGSFEEFVQKCTDTIEDIDGAKNFMFPQTQYICDDTGSLIVDFVGRFEQYERDANEILRRIGFGHLSVPKLNASNHRNYREYYTPQTQQLITERFATDLAMFDYAF